MSKKKKIKRLERENADFAKTNESGNAIKEGLGTCKDCEYSMFRGVMLLCRKYNVPMLYEAVCSDFYPKYTYAE